MDSSLLATKCRIPPLARHVVRRARLIDALEREIVDSKLVLVVAPAGYGKTTLLAQWARATRLPVVWMSIGAEDNDPERFFRLLLAAWRVVQPSVSASPLGLLLGAMSPDRDAVLAAFIDVANGLPDHAAFVIDDCHLIEEPTTHTALSCLLDHLPPTCHVVLAGREEPPLPLARYRAHGELLEFRADALAFSREETGEFLNRRMGLDLAADEIASIRDRLEGWIAGLQLASLTLRRRGAAAPSAISGRQRFIADYLADDVMSHLGDGDRRFLLETSILDRLCAPLCEAVTGRNGSQDMLEALERASLFLTPEDDRREWYRYHRLFAEFLRHQLERSRPEDVARLHVRAARWLLHNDLPEPAFRHAVLGGDMRLVAQIGEAYIPTKLQCGEHRIVADWLAALPAEWRASHPMISLAEACHLLFSGAFDACARRLDAIEQQLALGQDADAPGQRAKVAVVRCAIACFQNDLPLAERYAEHALRDLPDDARSFRADTLQALGETYSRHGRWDDARTCFLKVFDVPPDPGFLARSAHVYGALADLELRRGRLRDAAAYWRQALASIQERANWGRLPLPVIGWVHLRMGELMYEWNEVTNAWGHLSDGLEHAELGGDMRAMIAGCVLASRVKLTEGDVAAAAEFLERARPLVERAAFPGWTSRFERCQVELWLAQGRLRTAVEWVDAMLASGALESRPECEIARLALVRVLLAGGDARSRLRARELLDHMLSAATAEGRTGIEIEALALRALAHWQAGDRSRAMIALERALRMAEPEGYVRLFVDLGLPMLRVLQEARARRVAPDYVTALLAAGGAASCGGQLGLPEPLSRREAEVLRLIAAGLTNREIAETLCISPETVKKHAASIYGKLGVGRRAEAAAKVQALGLLDERFS
jgi:ATP/maltotriose-dependent transcriptional regulator MalT